MVDTRVYIGAYWGGRGDGCEACAGKAQVALSGIAAIHPSTAHFFEQADTKKDALSKKLSINTAALGDWLERCKSGRNSPKSAIDSTLGWSGAAWNGEEGDRSVVFSLRCGVTSARLGNAITLRGSERIFRELHAMGRCVDVLKLFIDAFQAQWGVIASSAFSEVIDAQPGEKIVGFVTYTEQALPDALLSKLPRHEPYARGHLLWLGDDLPDPGDAGAVALAKEIKAAINQK